MTLRNHIAKACRDLYVNKFVASSVIPVRVRTRMLNWTGHDIHPTAAINPGQFIGALTGLTMGPHSQLNYGCFFDLGAPVSIGAYTGLSYGTMVLTCSHELGDHDRRWGAAITAPVVIGDGCWIGAKVIILPGVTIGDGCMIAAGSVVASDCEADGLYGGSPARLLRTLPGPESHRAPHVDEEAMYGT